MRVQRVLVGGLVATAVMGAALFGTAATAQEGDTVVELPVSNVYLTGEVGSSVEVGSADVDPSMVGRTCNVVATITNQSSVHSGNKLVVTSGESTVEISGIEDTADAVTVQGGALTLGETISAAVVLGADGATSLGSSLTVTCEPLPDTPPAPPTPADPTFTG